jgi:SAM-dependent methyltransferase
MRSYRPHAAAFDVTGTASAKQTKQYDRAYFDTWYRRRGIGDARRLGRKVALAVATAEYHLERPIRTVLDIGCGEGAWRAPLLRLRPSIRYLGFDSSDYAVARYGRARTAGSSPASAMLTRMRGR